MPDRIPLCRFRRSNRFRKCLLVSVFTAIFALVVNIEVAAAETAQDIREVLKRQLDTAEYAQALKSADRLLEATKSKNGETSAAFAYALSWKGAILLIQGRLSESAPLLEEAVSLSQKLLKPDDPDLASALNNLGMHRFWSARYSEAEQLVRRGLDIRESQPHPQEASIAESLNNLGLVNKMLGRPVGARALFERALKLYTNAFPGGDWRIGYVLQDLASIEEQEGNYKTAEDELNQALRIYDASLAPGNQSRSAVRTRLGVLLFLKGEYAKAERPFREAYDIYKAFPQTPAITVCTNLIHFGTNQMQQGKLDEADALFREALAIEQATLPPKHLDLAMTFGNLAEIAYRKGDYSAALKLLESATAPLATRERFDDRVRLQFLRHVRTSWKLYEQQGSKASLLSAAFGSAQYAIRNDTGGTVERLGVRFAAQNPAFRELLKEREDLERRHASLEPEVSHSLALPQEGRTDGQRSLRDQLIEIEVRQEQIADRLKTSFPEYAELTRQRVLTVDEVQQKLKAHEGLILIYPAYRETYIWAVTSDKAAWARADIGRSTLDPWVSELRTEIASLKTPPAPLFNLGLANIIYDKLFSGISAVITGKRDLIIVAPAPLDSLPFHLLVKSRPPLAQPNRKQLAAYREADWLVRSHAISVLPSVGSLEALKQKLSEPAERKPLIGFGNPIFNWEQRVAQNENEVALRGRPGKFPARSAFRNGTRLDREALRSLEALPETEDELKTVARFVGGAAEDLKFGGDATETAVKQTDLARYRVVYFATHGLVAGDAGLGEPALVLTLPRTATEFDDGVLTASEIAMLKLDADWVILSACNTAAPEKPGAEDLSGLARSFFHAGARGLLVSHWPVISEAASRLVTGAFEALEKAAGLTKAEALQRAMLKVLNDPSDPRKAYPDYWAPFMVIGSGGL